MLSFLRDQGTLEPPNGEPVNHQAVESADHPAVQSSQQEYLTVSTQGKNVRKTTFLLAVLFSAGLFCLWFMIKSSSPPTASAAVINADDGQIEKAITRLTGVRTEMFSRMGEIVKKFYEFSDVQQVGVGELAKNPFEYEIFWDNPAGISDSQKGDSSFDPESMRQQQLRQEAANMRLLSIMATDSGDCCMIDEQVLYAGDTIGNFKVREIGDSFVKLELYRNRDKGVLGTPVILKLSE